MASKIRQPIDVPALEEWLSKHCPEIRLPMKALQFTFGQSNPTYLLTDSNGIKYVLRKKPPTKMISKKIHWIEREYAVLRALEKSGIPVPRVYYLCCDESVIGTPFYLMEYLEGRIFEEAHLPGVSAEDREDMWRDAVRNLAKLHALKIPSLNGGETFSKAGGFYERQLAILTGITNAQAMIKGKNGKVVGSIPYYDEMVSFFSNRYERPREMISLVHGDYKIDNLVFHKTEPRVIGILDWEMTAVGHPLSDLSHLLMQQLVANTGVKAPKNEPFIGGCTPGLPSVNQVLSWYRDYSGWDPRREFGWTASFDQFKNAIMCQGIKARMMTGQTNSSMANHYASLVEYMAESAKRIKDGMRRVEVLESVAVSPWPVKDLSML